MIVKYEGDFDTLLTQELVDQFIKDKGFIETSRNFFVGTNSRPLKKTWVTFTHKGLQGIVNPHFTVELAYYECESFRKNPNEIAFVFRSKKEPSWYHFSNLYKAKFDELGDHYVGDLHNLFSGLFEQLPEAVELMNVMTSIKLNEDLVKDLTYQCLRQRLSFPMVTKETEEKLIKNSIEFDNMGYRSSDTLFDLDIYLNRKLLGENSKRDINYRVSGKSDIISAGGKITVFDRHYYVMQSISTIFEKYAILKLDD